MNTFSRKSVQVGRRLLSLFLIGAVFALLNQFVTWRIFIKQERSRPSGLVAPSIASQELGHDLSTKANDHGEDSRLQQPKLLLQQHPSPSSHEYLVTAVIVETRCHPALSLVLLQAARLLGPEFRFVIYHSSRNEGFVKSLIDSYQILREMTTTTTNNNTNNNNNKQPPLPRLLLKRIEERDYGVCDPKKSGRPDYWYSKMFTNTTFWENLSETTKTPYALTLQSDTLLCRPFPTQEFISHNESFLGGISGFARLSLKIPAPENPPNDTESNDRMKYIHLNGGLSLRNVEWTMECIRQHNEDKTFHPNGWVEDSLFRFCREAEVKGTVHVNQIQAYSFASDNGVTLCYTLPPSDDCTTAKERRRCPVGVHKPWAQGVGRWGADKYQELVDSCPGLQLHEELCTGMKTDVVEANNKNDNSTASSICRAYDIDGSYTTFPCNCG